MYLIDTNILIYYLAKQPKVLVFIDNCNSQLYISDITVIEVLSYPYDAEELTKVLLFLQQFSWLPVSRHIVMQTATNRRTKKIKTPDAIIAATAQLHGCTVVTNNTKDFSHLPIQLINPLED